MAITVEQLLGSLGALALALTVVGALWRAHIASDNDVRALRDTAISGWREQTDATRELADAVKDRNRRDASHIRANDP
jgi:hypothetical protein